MEDCKHFIYITNSSFNLTAGDLSELQANRILSQQISWVFAQFGGGIQSQLYAGCATAYEQGFLSAHTGADCRMHMINAYTI